MTLTRAFSTVAAAAISFTAAGALLGLLVGQFAPSAYRALPWIGADLPNFSPIEFGIGQGALQGAMTGVAVGVVIVGFVTWYRVRCDN